MEIKIEELCKLYANLNSDYIRLKLNGIDYDSSISYEQSKRLNKIWEEIEKHLTKHN